MKIFMTVMMALLAAASVQAGDKHYNRLKKWSKMKAMEGCFGKENSKAYVSKMRRAVQECTDKVQPELSLPLFAKPHGHGDNDVSKEGDDIIDKLMKAEFLKKLLGGRKSSLASILGEDDDVVEAIGNKYRRYRRESDDENAMEMKFMNKIEMINKTMETEKSMYTCVMHKLGYIDEDHELSLDGMKKCINEMEWTGTRTWLKEQSIKDHEICYEYAQALPEEILNACTLGPKITKMKWFKFCMKMHKYETCMNYDIIEKLECAGMPIDGLVKDSQVKEKDLLPIIQELMFCNQ